MCIYSSIQMYIYLYIYMLTFMYMRRCTCCGPALQREIFL